MGNHKSEIVTGGRDTDSKVSMVPVEDVFLAQLQAKLYRLAREGRDGVWTMKHVDAMMEMAGQIGVVLAGIGPDIGKKERRRRKIRRILDDAGDGRTYDPGLGP